MAFAGRLTARHPLDPLTRESVTTPQTSLHAADRPVATPSTRCRCSASTPTSRPTPGAALPGTLASPRTGLTPAGCPELIARLRHNTSFPVTTPELLDAQSPRMSHHGRHHGEWPRSPSPRRSIRNGVARSRTPRVKRLRRPVRRVRRRAGGTGPPGRSRRRDGRRRSAPSQT
jgi:hypothetical protein